MRFTIMNMRWIMNFGAERCAPRTTAANIRIMKDGRH